MFIAMKKIFSLQGAGVVAMGLLLGSCVSQKKYDEAQRTIEQYRSDSAAWAAKYNSMQQNYSTLEQNNKQIQSRYDSINKTYMADQQRWQTYQGYFDQQTSTAQQIHQQLHTALENSVITNANVYAEGNEVYVNLSEKTFFASGSSKLTAKGKEALQKIAGVLKSNADVEVDVRTNLGTESYSRTGSAANVNSWSGDETRSDTKSGDKNTDTKVTTEGRANIGDSGYVGSGTVTKSSTSQDKNKKSSTTKSTVKTKTSPEQKSASMNTRVSGSKSYATKSKSENWSLHNARLNAIASELSNNGVASVHVMTASGNRMVSNTTGDQSSTTAQMNTSTLMNTSAAGPGYQIVVSSNDNWYDMMNENEKKSTGSTSGNSNKSTGSVGNNK
jgi:outer membrane protein OmpA-like peptidoglycan-associated protein